MPEESGVSGGSRMTGGKNILVVDDEQMIREAVSSYLEKQGCHVFQAETGQEALQVPTFPEKKSVFRSAKSPGCRSLCSRQRPWKQIC